MPDLGELFTRSRLVVIVTDSDDDAIKAVLKAVAADHPDRPLWGWSEARKLHALGPAAPDLSRALKAKPSWRLSELLHAFQKYPEEAFLVVLGVDKIDGHDSRLQEAVRSQQQDEPLSTWLVLVSHGGDLTALFAHIVRDLPDVTLDLRGRPAPAVRPAARPPRSLADIESLSAFDTPEWTDALNDLPPSKLKEICESRKYEACIARIKSLTALLKQVFEQKDELINLMAWCSIAQLPLLILGTFGTAKSMLVRQLALGLGIASEYRRINTEDEIVASLAQSAAGERTAGPFRLTEDRHARMFEYLVTRFTTPEELLGPVNVDVMLQHAIYLRQTRSLMPRAEIVFLDEVFKANSAILNSLLSIMNERLFYNAGLPWSVNLVMLFGASNEPPQEADLGAFYDRFPVRVLSDPVGNDRVENLLQRAHEQHVLGLLPRDVANRDAELEILDPGRASRLGERRMRHVACVNDFRLLRKVLLYKFDGPRLQGDDNGSKSFLKTYLHLYRNLRDEYEVSDRSGAHFYHLARARALLENRSPLDKEDCVVLRYCGKTPEVLKQLKGIVEAQIL